MAIIWFEHFDVFGTDIAALIQGRYTRLQGSLVAAGGRRGGNCFSKGNVLGWISRATGDRNIIGSGAAVEVRSVSFNNGNGGILFGTTSSPTQHISIAPSPEDNSIKVIIGGVEVARTPPLSISGFSYFWLEAKATRNTAGLNTGGIEVRVNGTTVLNLSGVNLPDAFVSVGLGSTINVVSGDIRYDDWVVWDDTGPSNNDFLGDCFIDVVMPISDGVISDWTATPGGPGWSTIDEVPFNDTDYITATAVGNINEFNHTNLVNQGGVLAVSGQVRALKIDTDPSTISVGVASGSSNSMRPNNELTTTAQYWENIAELNPDGNVAWDFASADAARLRIERTS